jgi:hypothetical protein
MPCLRRVGPGSLCHFFEAFGDELIDAFSRLRGLFGDAAVKLRLGLPPKSANRKVKVLYIALLP